VPVPRAIMPAGPAAAGAAGVRRAPGPGAAGGAAEPNGCGAPGRTAQHGEWAWGHPSPRRPWAGVHVAAADIAKEPTICHARRVRAGSRVEHQCMVSSFRVGILRVLVHI